MRQADIETLANQLGRMLAAVEAGGMDASPGMRQRLIGAVAALRIALGDDPDQAVSVLLSEDSREEPKQSSAD